VWKDHFEILELGNFEIESGYEISPPCQGGYAVYFSQKNVQRGWLLGVTTPSFTKPFGHPSSLRQEGKFLISKLKNKIPKFHNFPIPKCVIGFSAQQW
jgi:hypothetical protein